jgi:hypothetical protein
MQAKRAVKSAQPAVAYGQRPTIRREAEEDWGC